MNSNSPLVRNKFKKWTLLSKFKNRKEIPEIKCVYIFRIRRGKYSTVNQKRTDILYIGKTKNLRQRIWRNYLKGRGGLTTQRIHKNFVDRNYIRKVEISWHEAENIDKLEKDLLNKFEEEHHQLPAWNRQG